MKWDYMVIGQGLAGSILAYYLIKNNRSVLVFDDPVESKASMVAAGIYNPFTGRKLVKTWRADQLFPFLDHFYQQMQEYLGTKILYRMPMYRPFLTQQEQNEWGAKSHQAEYSQYIEDVVAPTSALPGIINPLGGLMLTRCGYLDLPALINGVHELLIKMGCFREEKFEETILEVDRNHIRYNGEVARRLVFCQGASLKTSKYFGWLPLRPVKGEIITIELEDQLNFIINRGVFVLPMAKNICRVGATFDHRDLNPTATDQGRQELEQKLQKLINIPYRITDHFAGIRPATADRRPFVGLHPEFEPLGIFNGLGTKGVSLAPYFVQEYFEFLERGIPLTQEVAINRHFSLYYNKI